jgi:hypothetical protein
MDEAGADAHSIASMRTCLALDLECPLPRSRLFHSNDCAGWFPSGPLSELGIVMVDVQLDRMSRVVWSHLRPCAGNPPRPTRPHRGCGARGRPDGRICPAPPRGWASHGRRQRRVRGSPWLLGCHRGRSTLPARGRHPGRERVGVGVSDERIANPTRARRRAELGRGSRGFSQCPSDTPSPRRPPHT